MFEPCSAGHSIDRDMGVSEPSTGLLFQRSHIIIERISPSFMAAL